MKGNNRVILQGWLHLSPQHVQTQRVDGQIASLMLAYLDTDSPALGGRHRVVLTGDNLGKALLLLNQHGGQPLKVQATVTGYLVTFRSVSHVVVTDLVLLLGTEEEVEEASSASWPAGDGAA